MEFLLPIIGFILGTIFCFLWLTNKHQKALAIINQELASTQQRLQFTEQSHAEKIQTLQEAKDQLTVQFQQLSEEALQKNTAQLLQLAQQQQEKQQQASNSNLQQRQQAIQEMLNPVRDMLQRLEREAKQSGEKQAQTHGQLAEQVKNLAALQTKVQSETNELISALRRPETRGRWGEITLKRVLEESGMLENCVFSEQSSMQTNTGATQRPDVVLSLPKGRTVAIDSKTPLDAYISLIDSDDQGEHLNRHIKHLRTHLKQLSQKQYWDSLQHSPEFVIMFIPVESAFALALKHDPAILEEGWRSKVVIATPSTLMATVMAISWSWKEKAIQEDLQQTIKLGKDLYDRFCKFSEYLEKTGRSLNTAMNSYNQAVSSFDSRLLPAARKFSDLSGKDLPELQEHDVVLKLPA